MFRKGHRLVHLRAFIYERRGGDDAWEGFVSRLSTDDRLTLKSVVGVAWYELEFHARVMRALCDHFCEGNRSIAYELGLYACGRDLAEGRLAWLVELGDISALLRYPDVYWRRENETGSWRCQRKDVTLAHLVDWGIAEAAMCEELVGYSTRLFEALAASPFVLHLHCRGLGDPVCEFRIRLSQRAPSSPAPLLRTDADVLHLLAELATCVPSTVRPEAVERLLERCMGLARVRITLGQVAVLKGQGKHPDSQDFVLVHWGRAIGRLVALPGQDPPNWEMLDRMMPFLGALFDERAPDPKGSPTKADDLLDRMASAAASSCSLTQQEQRVCRLMLEGKPNKDIAAALAIAPSTVETHVRSLLDKCGCRRTELWLRLILEMLPEIR